MRIGRTIIVTAIATLGAAGSLLAGSAMSATAGPQAVVHVQADAPSAIPYILFHT